MTPKGGAGRDRARRTPDERAHLFEAGMDLLLGESRQREQEQPFADWECRHGSLPGDRALACDCWEPRFYARRKELMEDLMDEVRKCKVEGCDNDAVARRGPYAGLCDPHKAQSAFGRRQNGGNGHHDDLEHVGAAIAAAAGEPRLTAALLDDDDERFNDSLARLLELRKEVIATEDLLRVRREELRLAYEDLAAALPEWSED